MTRGDLFRLFSLAALWGGSFLFMRVAAPELGAIPVTFGRVVLGALGLLAILAVLRVPLAFQGRLRATLVLGVINSGLPFLLFAFAARLLPAGYSAILNAMTPLMGVLIGAAFFGEKPTGAKLLGVGCGLAGVWVLTRTGPVNFDGTLLAGAAACLLATACYGLAGFLTKRWIIAAGGLDSRLVAFGSQIGAILFVAPFLLAQAAIGPEVPVFTVGAKVWLALLVLGLACTALAYILYFRLIADVGPVKALTVTFLIPPFGVLWGALFLGETLSPAHAGGSALIALALWLVLRPAPVAAPVSARS